MYPHTNLGEDWLIGFREEARASREGAHMPVCVGRALNLFSAAAQQFP